MCVCVCSGETLSTHVLSARPGIAFDRLLVHEEDFLALTQVSQCWYCVGLTTSRSQRLIAVFALYVHVCVRGGERRFLLS